MSIKGILFDFDGVAVDSMHQHYDAWSNAFKEKGISFAREDFFQLEGQGLNKIASMIGEKHGLVEQDLLDVVEAKVRYYYKSVEIRFYDYFMEMLDHLKTKGIPMGVVTGGNKTRVQAAIEKYFKDFFSALVTIDDVSNGKPHPEPFLKGAEKLALSPEECIVVENAPLGIKAAKAAGTTVIAVKTTLTDKFLSEADYIVDDFYMVEKRINQLLAK
jgi:HAD superfamily hydrolase (TIGR01509 family)